MGGTMKIGFNRPTLAGNELEYIRQAIANEHTAGDGRFTRRCHEWLERMLGAPQALITHSCTAALEMAALLFDVEPGDEVIVPSYTFVSTANAVALRGGVPVFVDRDGTHRMSEETIRDYRAAADQFFDWLIAINTPLASVKIIDVDDAITDKKARGTCGRRAMHDYAQRLRAFFRFAEARGWCTPGIADGIMPPRFERDEAVPKGLRREDVQRLLATTESDRPVDKRDRAIRMLF